MKASYRIYEFFASQEDIQYDNEAVITNKLQSELEELKMLIDQYNIDDFPKVKRFGLPHF